MNKNINIGGRGKNKDRKKSNEQKFYESVIQQIGALILHSVMATVFISVTIFLGVECATNGGYWVLLLSSMICVAVTIACIGAVIADACGMLLLVKELHDGKKKY